jgi:hypothetical protein
LRHVFASYFSFALIAKAVENKVSNADKSISGALQYSAGVNIYFCAREVSKMKASKNKNKVYQHSTNKDIPTTVAATIQCT